LSHVTHSKNGYQHTKHEFLPQEPFLCFLQRTCLIHYFRSKTHVWGGFTKFRCRTSPSLKTGIGLHTKHEFLLPEPFLRFRKEHAQSTTLGPKLMFGWFRTISLPHVTHSENGYRMHKNMSFCHRNHFFVFRNEHAQSTTLGPKLVFGVVSRKFVAARHPFRKLESGCIESTSFCHRNHFFVYRNEHAQSTTLGPKLMFGVVSRIFVAAHHPFQKRVSRCIQSMSFCHRNHFFVFHSEHAQSTTLGPKLMFRVVSRNFVAACHPLRKWVSGCKQSTSFRHWNHFFIYRNEHAQSTTLGRKLMFGVVSRNFVAARHPFRKQLSGA
jgi:hypothetical protein